MWIPKWLRDRRKGVDSPAPTQVVSNEEFIPRPQNREQKQVEYLVGELAAVNSCKLGVKRRSFLRSSMGMAAYFWASNQVYGHHWEVEEAELWEPSLTEERFPKGDYFICDVQTHFTNDYPLAFRNWEFVRNMGFDLKNDADADSFPNLLKEIFFDSETSMIIISSVPGKEINRGPDGKILDGADRQGGVLPAWLMSQRKREINQLSGSRRALCQGNCSPNHYWNQVEKRPDLPRLFEQMEREVKQYGVDSWKWYCHFDPGKSGDGFRLDDENVSYPFYERSKELGMNIFSVHKGYASQSETLGHYAHPGDIEKAALDHPDLTFIIYHSAMKHGPSEPEFDSGSMFDPTTGDMIWHDELMKIKQRNPTMDNVYPEIGSAFGTLAIIHPQMCMHLMGKNIQHYGVDHVLWGTDCLWWGSPQWVIDAFKRFQISDELCEKFGYSKLTHQDKAKIFGLNAARLYGVDVDAQLKALPADAIARFKTAYLNEGGEPENAAHGWVRDDS